MCRRWFSELLFFWILVFGFSPRVCHSEQKEDGKDGIPSDGAIHEVLFGGLFGIHKSSVPYARPYCGALRGQRGVQALEAMLFAVDAINNDPSFLPGLRIHVQAWDTCSSTDYTFEQIARPLAAQKFQRPSRIAAGNYNSGNRTSEIRSGQQPPRMVVLIGADSTEVSKAVATLLPALEIPQISYASTGIELSDKTRFEYFSRVVPPDDLQARAMVDVVKAFGWSYVSTVADEGNYGEKGIAAFESLAEKSGLCIARSLKIPREVKTDTFERILRELLSSKKAKVVVLFVNEDNCRRLVKATVDFDYIDDFYWLASDSWGAKGVPVNHQEYAAEGTVTILPQREVLQEFDRYFKALNPRNNKRNPWFVEFWESHFECSLTDPHSNNKCSGDERLGPSNGYDQEGVVPFVVDAVNAMGHALHNMIKSECSGRADRYCHAVRSPEGATLLSYILNVSFAGYKVITESSGYEQEGLVPFVVDAVFAAAHAIEHLHRDKCPDVPGVCPNMAPIAGEEMLHSLRNLSFIGSGGHTVKFNKKGDAMGRYSIYQFQRTADGGFGYLPIGRWADNLHINKSLTKWKKASHFPPRSVCSEECPPGHIKKHQGQDACCWVCIRCEAHQILKDKKDCVDCANGTYPNFFKNQCAWLPVQHMMFNSPWSIIPVVFASIGVLSIVFICAVFIKYNTTPVIMASGRELCYVLMFGLLLCYVMTFVMVAKPSVATCCLLRIGLGLSLSICYAAMFTKANRISRIFNRGVKAMVKRPSYTSPRSQLVICFCLVSVQIIGAITWVGMDLPGTTLGYPDRITVVLRCRSTNVAIVLSLLYNMILIIMCTVYAFKTRKIPENFNEAKYIAFTMYSTCIVWLAFIPIYFGTNKSDFRIQITALCMCVSISATVALGCLFVPKVYIVLFQPHKNVRQGSKGSMSGLGGRSFFGQSSGRFSSLAAMNGDITSPTGLALLIAQGMKKKEEPQDSDKGESMKDLDSSGPDVSEPETNL